MREPDSTGPDGADEDAALMLRVREGDEGAFARLYDRNARSVVSFAYRFVQDRGRAEEMAQEVFLKLHRSAGSYEPRARFKTFLFRIAANHCMNERRRGEYRLKRVEPAADGPEVEAAAPAANAPDEHLAGAELERAVADALEGLTGRERAAFCMCRFEGMPYREIAAALETSEPAVKSLIHRATVAVARRLAPVLGGDPLAARGAAHPRGEVGP